MTLSNKIQLVLLVTIHAKHAPTIQNVPLAKPVIKDHQTIRPKNVFVTEGSMMLASSNAHLALIHALHVSQILSIV